MSVFEAAVIREQQAKSKLLAELRELEITTMNKISEQIQFMAKTPNWLDYYMKELPPFDEYRY